MIKIGIFSGRFDPPNAGHFMTIERLMQEYHFLLVPILDYEGREGCSAQQAKDIFEYHFYKILPEISLNKIKFVINNVHFGKITAEQLHELLKENELLHNNVETTYLAGNEEVLSNIKNTGIDCKFVPRVVINGIEDQYMFESTKIRKEIEQSGKNIDEIYNIQSKT